jgi:uroporphyrinogen decarboxylase
MQKLLIQVLNGNKVAHPPIWLMRQAGRYLPEYRAIRERVPNFLEMVYTPDIAIEVSLQPIRRFSMDAAILFSDILVIPDALGQSVSFVAGEGPQLEPIRRINDVKKLNVSRLNDHLAPIYETVRKLAKSLDEHTALIGFSGSPWTLAVYMVEGRGGTDHTIIRRWAYEDPNSFGSLMKLLVESTIEYLCNQINAGAEVIQLFDTWAGVLSEEQFRRWCIAPTKEIVSQVKSRHPKIPIIGFPRNSGALYVDYIMETGVDAISLDSGVPLHWAAKNLQRYGTLQGNLDNQLLVQGGVAMDAEITRIIDVLGNGPLIFNLGHGIVPDTPPENVARLIAAVRGGT